MTALNLLLFSVGGVRFGVDAAQISGTTALADDDDEKPVSLDELLEFGDRPALCREPVVLDAASAAGGRLRVVVDGMEDIVAVDAAEIVPLPPAVESRLLDKGIWGVLPRGEQMILLLDFGLLPGREGPG